MEQFTRMTGPTVSTRGILNPAAGRAHFELTRYPPAGDLADAVERHWVVRWDLSDREPFSQHLLPHPAVNLVVERDRALVHGISTSRAARRLEGAGWAVGTKFRPGAAAGFVRVPAHELTDRSVTLVDAFGPEGAALEREVYAEDDPRGAHRRGRAVPP